MRRVLLRRSSRRLDDGSAQVAGQHRRLLGWRQAEQPRADAGSDPSPAVLLDRRGRKLSGRELAWTGPGARRRWQLADPVPAHRVDGAEVWATLDGAPIVAAIPIDSGHAVRVGFDSEASLSRAELGAVLRRALAAAPPAAAWLDLDGLVALRMDDPGASASVHLRPWAYERCGERTWIELGAALARQRARLTVSYTPAWVDDGDPSRGELFVGGRRVARRAGAVHPSPLVRYLGATVPSADCVAEYRGIQELRRAGLCTAELHGYTHMHPDLERWAQAEDRYEDVGWYREFAPETAAAIASRPRHPVELGLELFERHFRERPVALVCPGNAWAEGLLAEAVRLGFELTAATELAIRGDQGLEWCPGIAAIPFEHVSSDALAGELPVVALLHDRDLALEGVDSLERGLREWRQAGTRSFVDLRQLASAFGLRLELRPCDGRWQLEAAREHGPALGAPFGVGLRLPEPVPRRIEAITRAGRAALDVEPLADGYARVELPAGA